MPKRCEHVTSDALEILAHLTGKRRSFQESIAEARWQLEIAQAVCEARRRAGLSRSAIAGRVRVPTSEIVDLEQGRGAVLAFATLRKIVRAAGLELRLEITEAPLPQRKQGLW